MAVKKRKRGGRRVSPDVAEGPDVATEPKAVKPSAEPVRTSPDSKPPEQIKWRWWVVIGSLLGLSVLVLFLSWVKFFDLLGLDRRLQELLISTVGTTVSNQFDSRVVLILVDQAQQPNPPFGKADPNHRKFHANLIRMLSQAGAKVVVFDVLFRTNSIEVDKEFAQAIQEAEKAGTKIVVGAFLPVGTFEPQLAGLIKAAVGDHWGIVDGGTPTRGASRFIRLAGEKSNQPFNGLDEQPVIPSLALQAVRLLRYPDQQTGVSFSPLAGQVRLRTSAGELLDSIPVNDELYMLVDLPGQHVITNYSYQEVHSHLNDYAPNFKDKVVIIGYQDGDVLPGTGPPPRYGAEAHATAVSTLLTGEYIRPVPVLYHYLTILGLVAVAAFLQIRFSKWMNRMQTIPLPFLPAPLNQITIPTPIFVISLVYLLLAAIAFKFGHIIFDMTYHLAALILTYFLFVIFRSQFVRK